MQMAFREKLPSYLLKKHVQYVLFTHAIANTKCIQNTYRELSSVQTKCQLKPKRTTYALLLYTYTAPQDQ